MLLVEDEPVNAAVAEGYLAALGCTSVWVKSGADAVARSAAEHFDLVLMDLNMPDIDGFSATRLIRQREGKGVRTAIVALTAHDAIKLASSAANVGALAYGKELRRLEQLCIAGDRSQAQELNRAIQAAYPALMDALLGLTMRASA